MPKPPILDILVNKIPLSGYRVLLGVSEHGNLPIPVSIDLRKDKEDGSILVTGGMGCGKSDILQSVARQALWKRTDFIDVAVITKRPHEWGYVPYQQRNLQNIMDQSLRRFVEYQNNWAQENTSKGNPLHRVVIIQNLFACMNELQENNGIPDVVSLFTNAADGGITVVASCEVHALNDERVTKVLPLFRQMIIGHMDIPEDASIVGHAPTQLFPSLTSGVEFVYTKPHGKPIQFWAPSVPLYKPTVS